MKPIALVYTSNTGHTRQYALLLAKQIGLPAYSLDEANSQLSGGSPVIYLGWIHASHVKGYAKAASRFDLCAVCAVGLCDTGTLTSEVRKATSIPADIPLFTLQGGMDRSRLKGMDKLMISMLSKGLASQKQRSAQDDRMLELLRRDESYVSPENLAGVLQWYKERYT
ncbi:MAG: hypothetical protein ACI3VX_02200 [Faecousia sp.]